MNTTKQQAADELAHLAALAIQGRPVPSSISARLVAAVKAYNAAGPWSNGDESADPDLGPRTDLLAGLTTALKAAVDELNDGRRYHAAYLALKDLLLLHPEPDVSSYLTNEVNRMRHDRSVQNG